MGNPLPIGLKKITSSEAVLLQAIAGLLSRSPDVENIQILHGAIEYGKDLVFHLTGAFGESLPCSCVIKKTKITGDVDSNLSARTIFHQVEQSFDTPYTNESGEEVFIQRVYVISPYLIPQTTISSVKGALKSRSGQIIFVSGQQLVLLFQKFWPDFLADEASVINRYLSLSEKALERNPEIERISLLYDIDLEKKDNSSTYVKLSFEAYFPVFKIEKSLNKLYPSKNDIHKPIWQYDDYLILEEQLNAAASFFKYVCDSGVYTESKDCNNDKLTKLSKDFIEQFKTGWKSYAKEHFNFDRDNQERGAPRLLGNAKIGLNKKKELLELLEQISDHLYVIDRPLRKEINDNNELLLSIDIDKINPIDFINNPSIYETYKRNNFLKFINNGCLSGQSGLHIIFPSDLIDKTKNSLLITGPAGSGKTSFCRWNALRDIEIYLNNKSDCIPFYVALNAISIQKINSIWDIIHSIGSHSAFIDDEITKDLMNSSHRIRLYLDGLDEVFLDRDRMQLLGIVEEGIKNERIQIIVTSRDYLQGAWLNSLIRISLKSIDNEQFELLADKWFSHEKATTKAFLEQLKLVPEILAITTTPLLATLTILIFKTTGRLPENRVRLYEAFIDLLSGGWDLAKGILRKSHFSRDIKIKILACLAYNVHRKGLRLFELRLIVDAISWEYEAIDNRQKDILINELLSDTILAKDGDSYCFRHLSFQEYLAARHCINKPKDTKIKYGIKSFNEGNDWWRDVIRFYIGMIGGEQDFMTWLNTIQAKERRNEFVEFYKETKKGAFTTYDSEKNVST